MSAYDQILAAIHPLKIVDTHEHLPEFERLRPQDTDILAEWLTHYFSCDLVSAGLSADELKQARDSRRSLAERWQWVAPYWDAARHTGYGQSLALAARDLYGIEQVDADSIEELDRRFRTAREKGGHYAYVLKEKSRIAVSVLDRVDPAVQEVDDDFFAPVVRMTPFIQPSHRRDIEQIGKRLDMRLHSIRDWKAAMEISLEQSCERGAVAIKIGLAYHRSLRFNKTSEAEAAVGFNELFDPAHSPEWRRGIKISTAFQDHMVHHLLTLADRRGMTVQVHTGLQEGNGNMITDSNPTLLANLFLEYGDVSFDLFHLGYPYVEELGTLAKNFANVYIDMCWGHMISPVAARRALDEWLELVPANKISAFGGDYCFVDGVYGHQYMARCNVAATLAEKVQRGLFDVERAIELAQWLLVENPSRLFCLPSTQSGA